MPRDELDGQGQPAEQRHHLGDVVPVAVGQPEPDARGPAAGAEQLHGGRLDLRGRIGGGRQRADGHPVLAAEAQRLEARREQVQLGRAIEPGARQLCDRRPRPIAAVEDEQGRAAPRQDVPELRSRIAVAQPHTQRPRDRRDDAVVGQGGVQLGDVGSAGVARALAAGELGGEPRLADAGRADQRREPRAPPHAGQRADLLLPPDERAPPAARWRRGRAAIGRRGSGREGPQDARRSRLLRLAIGGGGGRAAAGALGDEPAAVAVDRSEARGRPRVGLDLLPQAVQRARHRPRPDAARIAPHLAQQLGVRNDPVGVGGEEAQQLDLERRQREPLLPADRHPLDQIGLRPRQGERREGRKALPQRRCGGRDVAVVSNRGDVGQRRLDLILLPVDEDRDVCARCSEALRGIARRRDRDLAAVSPQRRLEIGRRRCGDDHHPSGGGGGDRSGRRAVGRGRRGGSVGRSAGHGRHPSSHGLRGSVLVSSARIVFLGVAPGPVPSRVPRRGL